MNRQPYRKPPRWWSPKPSVFWIRFWRRRRRQEQVRKHRLVDIKIHGLEHIRQSLDDSCGVLITPNHASHADPFAVYHVAERLNTPFYGMIAWQNFVRNGVLRAWILRQHGGFSVDREGNDLAAFRQAVDVLRSRSYPLVVFPEGDVYHSNDRILPFREGPAAIALSAARRADRPVLIVPCAIKYRYLTDPTPELVEVMARLEESIHWRPRTDLTLPERIHHLGEGALSLKEVEYYGRSCSGSFPDRIHELIDFILLRLEACYKLKVDHATVAERVKLLRQQVIQRMVQSPEGSSERGQCEEDIADLFFAIQLFSYPGDYVSEDPSIERIAETIDKLEEDVLGAKTASIKGSREATVILGEPIPVPSVHRGDRLSATDLTRALEARVQGLLNGRSPRWHSGPTMISNASGDWGRNEVGSLY